MALITCQECGKEVSDKATSCPSCGAPIGNTKANTKFCKHCGENIDKECIICPKCGKQVEEIKNSNTGKALEVKEVKGKQYYDNLKNTRKELGLKYTEFRKDKITPIPQKAHDNLPMVNINIGNKTKQVKDYNRLESVRSSKLNLKKLIEVREQMRFATTKDARNLQNIPRLYCARGHACVFY